MTDNNHTSNYVFISYSRQDKDFVERLRNNFEENQIQYWVDREGIAPGASNWEHAIRDAIQGARHVIYVATPSAYRSNIVQGELALAEMYGLRIYPVWADGEHILECVPLKMNKTQYIDMRGESYIIGFGQLLSALKEPDAEQAYTRPQVQPLVDREPRNPYKGLRAFTREDAQDFFGRERLVTDLVKMIEDRIKTNSRLLAVIGPSGSGKSSVVMAGLLPTLEKNAIAGSDKWRYLPPFTPGNEPLMEMAMALRSLQSPNYDRTLRKELTRPDGRGLVNIARDVVKQDGQYLVVYIDQFEELFTLVDEESEREQFINTIVMAATEPDSPVIIVLTLRADFYDRPMNYNLLAELVQNNNRSVLPLTLNELNDAITLPAQLDDVQLEFEPNLVAKIAFDLLEFRVPADKTTSLAGALPLLQFALSRLFSLRKGNQLTLNAYEEMGHVSGAIGSHAEDEFKKLSEIQDEVLNRVFYYLVTINENGAPTRRRSKRSVITQGNAAAERLIEMLVQNRLLVAGKEGMLEVAHEALLRSWGRLAEWIDSNSGRIKILQKVQAAAADWVREEKPDRLLWAYEELQPVYEATDHLKIKMDASVQEFIRPQPERLLDEFETAPEHRQMSNIDRWREIGADAAPALVRALTYAKGDEVTAAIDRALWQEAQAAETALIAALAAPTNAVREAAAQAIGRLGVIKAVDALVANVQDADRKNNLAEIEALAAIHQSARKHPAIVDALVAVLQDQDNRHPIERSAAATTLSKVVDNRNERVIKCMMDAIDPGNKDKRDRSWEVRHDIVVALGELRATNAEELLLEKAKGNERGESYHVRRAAIEALGMLGNVRQIWPVTDAAYDESDDMRYAAVKALGSLGGYRGIGDLKFLLKDKTARVKQATAEALGQAADRSAVNSLTTALKDEETPSVRAALVNALCSYPYLSEVAEVLRSVATNDTPMVRAAAAEGLGLMERSVGANISTLLEILKEKTRDDTNIVKEAAIRSLGKLKTNRAVSPLLDVLKRMRRWPIRFEAAVALAEIGEGRISEDLREILNAKDSDAAFAAAVALTGVGENTERVKNELLSALSDPRPEARCIAASALGKLKDKETLPRLLEEMHNQDAAVRKAAARAIYVMDTSSIHKELLDLSQHPFQGVRETAKMALNG